MSGEPTRRVDQSDRNATIERWYAASTWAVSALGFIDSHDAAPSSRLTRIRFIIFDRTVRRVRRVALFVKKDSRIGGLNGRPMGGEEG